MKYLKKYDAYSSINETRVLLAPNGLPSNLKPNLYKIVRSPEFKLWFGDWENNPAYASKMVDENGEPLVCYHGSNIDFSFFNMDYQKNGWLGKGFYFTNDKKATKEYGRIIFQTFLNIRNPFKVKGEAPSDVYTEIKEEYNYEGFSDDVSIVLKENNHDGIFFKHWDKGNMFTCFYPSQIKFTKDFK